VCVLDENLCTRVLGFAAGIVAAVCRDLCRATVLWQAQNCNVARAAEMRQTKLHILSKVHSELAQLNLFIGGGGARPAASRWQKPADPYGVPQPRWGTVCIMFISEVAELAVEHVPGGGGLCRGGRAVPGGLGAPWTPEGGELK
jgi:hypothetical protein